MIRYATRAKRYGIATLLVMSGSTTAIAATGTASVDGQITRLVDYQISANGIAQPLTDTPGDVKRGRAVFLDRARGHCLLCHSLDFFEQASPGTIGPSLNNVGDRLSSAALRLRIVDSTRLNPNTAMPAYYRTQNLHQVSHAYQGQPVLTAQEVEDLVKWLSTLRSGNAN